MIKLCKLKQSRLEYSFVSGANPNKTVSNGMTCLGEASHMGNIEISKLLITASKNCNSTFKTTSISCSRKRSVKCQKRKLNKLDVQSGESSVKCKNLNDRLYKEQPECMRPDRNQGYFVFIHSEVSSSDENRIASLKSPLSPTSLTPSPQADLEWDEEIGNVAPTTSEDETWSSMYKFVLFLCAKIFNFLILWYAINKLILLITHPWVTTHTFFTIHKIFNLLFFQFLSIKMCMF